MQGLIEDDRGRGGVGGLVVDLRHVFDRVEGAVDGPTLDHHDLDHGGVRELDLRRPDLLVELVEGGVEGGGADRCDEDGEDDGETGHEILLVKLVGTRLKTKSSVYARRTKKPIAGYFWKEIHNNRL